MPVAKASLYPECGRVVQAFGPGIIAVSHRSDISAFVNLICCKTFHSLQYEIMLQHISSLDDVSQQLM